MFKLSVIIPFKDDISNLKLCLESLKSQDTDVIFETIVVDDGSAGKFEKEVKSISLDNLTYIYQKNKGPASARNKGIIKSKANLLAFIDSDCIPAADWVERLMSAAKENRNAGVIGGNIGIDLMNRYALVSQFLTTNAMYDNVDGKKQLIFMPTCNMLVRKAVFRKIGTFDTDFRYPAGEDLEFCWRAFKSGISLKYDENIIIRHNLSRSLKSYIKQAYRYGKGNYLAKSKHPDHPELNSIKIGSPIRFYSGCIMDLANCPRFAFIFSKRIHLSYENLKIPELFNVYFLLTAHAIAYVFGNISGCKENEN